MGEQLNQIVPPDCSNPTGPDQPININELNSFAYANNTKTTLANVVKNQQSDQSEKFTWANVNFNEDSQNNVSNTTLINEDNSTITTNTRSSKFPNLHHHMRLMGIQKAIEANNLDIQKQWEDQISSSQIQSKSNTKILAIQINGQTFKGLFDTGAGATVMSRNTAKKANCQIQETNKTCRSADQNSMNLFGETNQEVELNGRKIIQKFLVVDKLNHPIIFGMDFIIKFGIIPLLYNNEYCFQDKKEEKYQFLGSTAPTAINVLDVKVKLDLSKYSKGARDIFSKLCDLTIRRGSAATASLQEQLPNQKQPTVEKVPKITLANVVKAVNEVSAQSILPESADLYHEQSNCQPSVLPSQNGIFQVIKFLCINWIIKLQMCSPHSPCYLIDSNQFFLHSSIQECRINSC